MFLDVPEGWPPPPADDRPLAACPLAAGL